MFYASEELFCEREQQNEMHSEPQTITISVETAMEISTMIFHQMQEIEYLENAIIQQASRYEKELKYAKDACAQTVKLLRQRTQKVWDLEEDLKKLNEKLEEATTSITAQEKRIALLEKRNAQTVTRLKARTEEVWDMEEKLEDSNSKLQEAEKLIIDQQKKIVILEKLSAQTVARLREEVQRLFKLESLLKKYENDDAKKVSISKDAKINRLEKQNGDMRRKINTLEKDKIHHAQMNQNEVRNQYDPQDDLHVAYTKDDDHHKTFYQRNQPRRTEKHRPGVLPKQICRHDD